MVAFNCTGSALLCADSLTVAHRLLLLQCTSLSSFGALPLEHVGAGDERLAFSDYVENGKDGVEAKLR